MRLRDGKRECKFFFWLWLWCSYSWISLRVWDGVLGDWFG